MNVMLTSLLTMDERMFLFVLLFYWICGSKAQTGCSRPPEISNGFLASGSSYSDLSWATYDCEQGYDMVGHPTSLQCKDGDWVGVVPRCVLSNEDDRIDVIMWILIGVGIFIGLLLLIGIITLILWFCCFRHRQPAGDPEKGRKTKHSNTVNADSGTQTNAGGPHVIRVRSAGVQATPSFDLYPGEENGDYTGNSYAGSVDRVQAKRNSRHSRQVHPTPVKDWVHHTRPN